MTAPRMSEGARIVKLPSTYRNPEKIELLPGRHARDPGSPGQPSGEIPGQLAVADPGQRSEGEGLQGVAGENRGGLVKGSMAGRAATSQIVVVHCRQVIVDERVGVQHFQRDGGMAGRRPDLT